MKRIENTFSKFPFYLAPHYRTLHPNSSIPLYSGSLVLTQGSKTFTSSEGSIELVWLPRPEVRFIMTSMEEAPDLGAVEIEAPDIASRFYAYVKNVPIFPRNYSCSGIITNKVVANPSIKTQYARFHLPNMERYIGEIVRIPTSNHSWRGRLTLKSANWIAVLDELPDAKELSNALQLEGGYALMHSGELRKTDDQTFTYDEANEMATAIFYFLSFTRGFWISPLLM